MKQRLTIISGGQTGVDRGALDAALTLNTPCGGWCPAGRKAEDGPLANRYPLRETKSDKYVERTHLNVIDSDATLIIYFDSLTGGTRKTFEFCQQEKKPFLLLNLSDTQPEMAVNMIRDFIRLESITTLNVAGPRASHQPQAYELTRAIIESLLAGNAQ